MLDPHIDSARKLLTATSAHAYAVPMTMVAEALEKGKNLPPLKGSSLNLLGKKTDIVMHTPKSDSHLSFKNLNLWPRAFIGQKTNQNYLDESFKDENLLINFD